MVEMGLSSRRIGPVVKYMRTRENMDINEGSRVMSLILFDHTSNDNNRANL